MFLEKLLKRRLWDWYGTLNHPAEWDGHIYGGGKISQRFWEYFITIQMLDLSVDSVIVDIGGGSPATGLSIFPRLLAAAGVQVIAVDENFADLDNNSVENVLLERTLADRDSLSAIFRKYNPTHLSCVSVLEHASFEQQRGIFEAVEESFNGDIAVFTFEFHEKDRFFEQQLTTASLSNAVQPLKRYYLERIERSPLHCVNGFNENARAWYPMAARFERGFR